MSISWSPNLYQSGCYQPKWQENHHESSSLFNYWAKQMPSATLSPKISFFKKNKNKKQKRKKKCRIKKTKQNWSSVLCFNENEIWALRLAPSALQFFPLHLLTPSSQTECAGARRCCAGRGGRDEGLPTISARSGFFEAFRAPWVPKVSAENAWVPWSTAGGSSSERDQRAGAGERGRRGRLRRPHGGGGGRSRREEEEAAEEVGGVGRSPAPVARTAAVCSLPATRGALIRRPEPPGRPLPPRRPRHAGPRPAPPAPSGAAGAGAAGAGGVGRTAPAAGPEQGRALKPRGGSSGRDSAPTPGSSPSPRDGPGEVAAGVRGGGRVAAPTGGTGFELIIGRGRVPGPVQGFRKFPSSYLHCSPAGDHCPLREPPEAPGRNDPIISPADTSRLPRFMGGRSPPFSSVYALFVYISFKRCCLFLESPGCFCLSLEYTGLGVSSSQQD